MDTTTTAAQGAAELGVAEAFQTALIGYGLTIVVAVAAAGLIWVIVMVLEKMKHRKTEVPAPTSVSVAVAAEPEPEDDTAKHVAAIAAAVYAAIGAHRLVYLAEATPQPGWRTTGRVLHQSSHLPKRSPNR